MVPHSHHVLLANIRKAQKKANKKKEKKDNEEQEDDEGFVPSAKGER
jgi:hypothetical protein